MGWETNFWPGKKNAGTPYYVSLFGRYLGIYWSQKRMVGIGRTASLGPFAKREDRKYVILCVSHVPRKSAGTGFERWHVHRHCITTVHSTGSLIPTEGE